VPAGWQNGAVAYLPAEAGRAITGRTASLPRASSSAPHGPASRCSAATPSSP